VEGAKEGFNVVPHLQLLVAIYKRRRFKRQPARWTR